MEERGVNSLTRRKRGDRRWEGYISGDCRCGVLTWVPGLSGEHASTGGLDEAAERCATLGGAEENGQSGVPVDGL
jgi:hypothetical protein